MRKAVPFVVFVALLSVLAVLTILPPPLRTSSAAHAQSGGAFVLIERSAFLYATPSESAEKVRDPWRREHRVRLGPYWVMRQRATRDGWVELRTIPEFAATGHCYPTVAGLDDLDLTLYAKRNALAKVTTGAVRLDFDDATSLKLTAGVGLVARGGPRYEATIPGATLRLRLRDGDVGASYGGARTFPASRGAIGFLTPGGRVEFEGGRLVAEAGGPRRRASRTVSFSAADTRGGGGGGPPRALLAVETTGRRGQVDATVRAPCAEIRGRLDGRHVSRERPPRSVHTLDEHHGTRVRAGASIYWPDGSRAGRAARDTALDGRMTSQGPHRCFAHRLRTTAPHGADEALTLCVDATDLITRGARRHR